MYRTITSLIFTGILFLVSIPTIVDAQIPDLSTTVQDKADDPTHFIPKTKAIILGGLSIEMSLRQMERIVSDKGYECLIAPVLQQAAYMDITSSEMTFDKNSKFCYQKESNAHYLRVSDDKIFYQCAYFKVCNQGLQEIAQSLIDQGKIDQLTYDINRIGQTTVEKYCGSGVEGDRLCVVQETYENKSVIYIELLKGSMGNGGRSFD